MGDFALPDLRDRILVHQSSGYNPALRLNERLGFRQRADKGVYFLMERSPESYSPPHQTTST